MGAIGMNIPYHIAIIPDGNRRWANKRVLTPMIGHTRGAKTLENLFETVFDSGAQYLSFWAASMENLLKRPKEEVDFLDHFFKVKFDQLLVNKKIYRQKIKVNIFGRYGSVLSKETQESIKKVIEATEKHDNLFLNFLIAYNGTDEMIEAIKSISRYISDPLIKIDYDLVKSCLWTKNLPPVDLLIRTGGEPHLSAGFMMWLMSDAQLYFTDTLWPDFTPKEFKKAIAEYGKRIRRFGK